MLHDHDRWIIEREKDDNKRHLDCIDHRALDDNPDHTNEVQTRGDLQPRSDRLAVLLVDFPCDEAGGQDVLREVERECDEEDWGDLFGEEGFRVLKPVPVDECRACGTTD